MVVADRGVPGDLEDEALGGGGEDGAQVGPSSTSSGDTVRCSHRPGGTAPSQGSGEIAEVGEHAKLPRQLGNGVRRGGTDGERLVRWTVGTHGPQANARTPARRMLAV